jgi:putative transposase
LHYPIACQRKAAFHELSHKLTQTCDRIVIEDLNVRGMVKNCKLDRAILDSGFGIRCTGLLLAKHFFAFFPSSKTCSYCDQLHELTSSDRTLCDCGLMIDRDLNAAINLNNYRLDTRKPDVKRTSKSGKPVDLSTVRLLIVDS